MTYSVRHFITIASMVVGGSLTFNLYANEQSSAFNNNASIQSNNDAKTNTTIKKARNDRNSPADKLTRYLTQHEINSIRARAPQLIPNVLPVRVTTAQ